MSVLLPPDCGGAVSLTFDDGTRTQRELAVPVLAEHGLRGTFYLNPHGATPEADDWSVRLAPWVEVARTGHELGNHTLTHPCQRFLSPQTPARCLEALTLADIEHEVAEAQRRLAQLTGVTQRSFAYPCCGDYVGEGPTQQSYVPVVARHAIAARHGLHTHTYLATCNLHTLPSMVCWRHSGAEMIGWADRAAQTGAWLIYMFHGIGGEHLSVTEEDFRQLCAYLARPANGLWVAPVVEVAEAVRKERQRCAR